MGLLDKILGSDDSEARVNSLIGSNRKLTDMLSTFMTSYQQQLNHLNEDIERIKIYIRNKEGE